MYFVLWTINNISICRDLSIQEFKEDL